MTYKAVQWVGRNEKGYDPAILNAAFRAVKPEEGKTSYTSTHIQMGDGIIVAIKGVKKGEVKQDDPSRNFMGQFMQHMLGNEELAALIAEIKEQADIEIFESRLQNDDS